MKGKPRQAIVGVLLFKKIAAIQQRLVLFSNFNSLKNS
jgi:hypothetical protein